MVGEVKWWRTVQANWRIERVAGESGGRRWEVTGWRAGAEQATVALGRWVTWKAAVEAIVRQEEQWAEVGAKVGAEGGQR